jgi:hypothetical protein
MMTEWSRGRLLLGARELARHVLGDEDKHRLIYGLAPELPVFMFGGRIAGYERELDAAMAAKQAGGKETATQRRRAAKDREAV